MLVLFEHIAQVSPTGKKSIITEEKSEQHVQTLCVQTPCVQTPCEQTPHKKHDKSTTSQKHFSRHLQQEVCNSDNIRQQPLRNISLDTYTKRSATVTT